MIKRILVSLVAVLSVLTASAEFRWGPTAGVNFNTYNFKQDLIDVKMSTGGQAGVMGEMMFPGIGFGIDLGLLYNLHGAKINLGQKEVWAADGYGNEQVWMHTLQIPVHLRFKYTRLSGLERYIAPFAFAGPVFTFHLSDNGCKAIESPAGTVSIQFGLGVELKERFQIFGSYDLGVSYELRTLKLDNFSARPSTWNEGVAYLF